MKSLSLGNAQRFREQNYARVWCRGRAIFRLDRKIRPSFQISTDAFDASPFLGLDCSKACDLNGSRGPLITSERG